MESHRAETFVHLFHIFIVGFLFLYVGIKRENVYGPVFPFLLVLGFVVILYHLYKIYTYLRLGKGIWVNLIHVLIVGPLLMYIGYHGEKTSRKFFEILLMLGFASIGYHLYYLF
jgi:hypothetical protein